MERVKHTLMPFYDKESKILILGTMPSPKSRELGFYYMHSQNRFWSTLATIFHDERIATIDERKAFLKRYHIALWDVLASCEISGASDSSIRNPKVNPIAKILKETKIQKIFTTGKTAYHLYYRYCYQETGVEAILLPSPSPANCRLSKEALVESYQAILLAFEGA